ncbi:helix-turn-helix domain-containing protein [Sphingomonas sp. A2-49]|uniref:helix-turn-helix domain-containing protein n=1 Tax=Sphingomonas sp. A2-49 TaxID=1391375 RepID=UPI0021D364A6|nr:helix-turn-helix domain-containing protein [Sphingomonas sp. A2-49]MCU6453944.1 helix-turn-helix domain-containing protein [Sphingomonas sp. A2-49]
MTSPSRHPHALWRPQPQFAHTVTDVRALEPLNAGGGIAVAFAALPKTALHIAFGGSQTEQLSVWTTRTESGFRTTRKIDADLVTIRFVHSGAMSRIGTRGNDIAVAFDQALFGNFEDMRYEQASPGFSAITATVGRDAIVTACQTLGGSGCPVLPQFAPVVDTGSLGLAALRHTVGLLLHHLPEKGSEADLMTPLLEELLVYQFVSAWPATGAPAGGRTGGTAVADRPVRMAVDYIEANLRHRIAIAEIAAASGLSVRMLQIAFKRRLGYSPVQYLIARRLDRVHADLLGTEGRTVRQIATDWGFVHMSDFGRRYRERFGHTPGEALLMRAGPGPVA